MTNSDDDAVGYRRPPLHTRFRPGQSGNPSGRPKRRPSFRDALLAELGAVMPGTDADGAGSKLEFLVRALIDSAIAGNARAQSIVIGALTRIGEAEEQESPTLTRDDREILDAYVGDELQRRAGEAGESQPVKARGDERRPDADDQNEWGRE